MVRAWMGVLISAAAVMTACGGSGDAPTTPRATVDPAAAAQAYLDSALDLMQTRAFYRSRVDWPTVRAAAHGQAAGATSFAATYPAIRSALAALGDHHSFLQPPAAADLGAVEGAERAERVERAERPLHAPTAHAADSLDGEIVGGRYGYLRVPTFGPPLGTADYTAIVNRFADTLQRLVRAVDTRSPCGWVVDLRHNLGGNMWPMLVGVGPIIGPGPYGSFLGANGIETSWFYSGGAAGVTSPAGTTIQAHLTGTAYTLTATNPPVAVLTDSLTASSGEAITVAFRGRAATRSFGAATLGVPTANTSFHLHDNAFLQIMTALDVDRADVRYDTRIPADEAVPQSGLPSTDDAAVTAATAWLSTQAACKG
jgi:C-terminal processing protease CtpA/Prc